MVRFTLVWIVCLGCIGGGDGGGVCLPATCGAQDRCGTVDDGCGHQLDCGPCAAACGGTGQAPLPTTPIDPNACAGGWCWEAPSPLPFHPTAAFTVTASDVWAIGSRGIAYHFDGTAWHLVPVGTTEDLHGIWMASATDGWLVGGLGTLRHWDGAAWTAVDTGTSADLWGVSGTRTDDVWLVGDRITRHWNGTAWTSAAVSPPLLTHVYAAPNGKVIAADDHVVWQLDGATWHSFGDSSDMIYGLAGAGNTAYAVGEVRNLIFDLTTVLQHWDGTSWQSVTPTQKFSGAFSDGLQIYGITDDQIYIIDSTTLITNAYSTHEKGRVATGTADHLFVWPTGQPPSLYHNGTWTPTAVGTYERLVTASVVGDRMWFGGDANQLLEWNGGEVAHPLPRASATVAAIAGASSDAMWAAEGEVFSSIYHCQDGKWQSQDLLTLVRALHVGADPTDVVMLGDGIYHLTGSMASPFWDQTWTSDPVSDGANVSWIAATDVGDDIIAVGDDRLPATPAVAHVAIRHAGVWTAMPAPTTNHLCGVAATSTSDVWAVGYNDGATDAFPAITEGTVSHWDGTAWTTTTHADAATLCAIALTHGEVWTAGDASPLLHRAIDGTWDATAPLFIGSIHALTATGDALWLAGDSGAVLRRSLTP